LWVVLYFSYEGVASSSVEDVGIFLLLILMWKSGGLGDVEMAAVDEIFMVTEEEGEQQQGTNVGTINVGVAHNDDAAIAPFGNGEVFVDASSKGGDDVLTSSLPTLCRGQRVDVEDFTSQGRMA